MLRVAIGSIGTVGLQIAKRLDEGIDGLVLTAVSARDEAAAEHAWPGLSRQYR